MKTRTAVFYSPGEPIRVEEIELDQVNETYDDLLAGRVIRGVIEFA